jgi:hypothetical protein
MHTGPSCTIGAQCCLVLLSLSNFPLESFWWTRNLHLERAFHTVGAQLGNFRSVKTLESQCCRILWLEINVSFEQIASLMDCSEYFMTIVVGSYKCGGLCSYQI